jgi:hypothetical protein
MTTKNKSLRKVFSISLKYLVYLLLIIFLGCILYNWDEKFEYQSKVFYSFGGYIDSEITYNRNGYITRCGELECRILNPTCKNLVHNLETSDRIYKEPETWNFLVIKAGGKIFECQASE